MTYTMAATAKTHSEASMTCAALRGRARPVLTSAKPAPASGTSRIRTTQSVAEVSERADRSANPLSFWNQMGADNKTQPHQLYTHSCQDESSTNWQRR